MFTLATLALAATALASTPGKLSLVKNTTCLDGSPAGFYYTPPASGGSSDTLVLFLEGGGACFTEETCVSRSKSRLGSSTHWSSTTEGDPLVSNDPSKNPFFYDAHHVFVPYCNGDVHSGTRPGPSRETWDLWFTGHNNLATIVETIIDGNAFPGVETVKHVLLSGESAGGYGTFLNADWLTDRLAPLDVSVKAAPIGGFFFPTHAAGQPSWMQPSAFPCWVDGKSCGAEDTDAVIDLWESVLDPACTSAQAPGAAFRCGSVGNLYPFIRTPMFIAENDADTNQLFTQLLLPQVDNTTTEDYVKYFVEAMQVSTAVVGTLANKTADALFRVACFDHTGNIGITSSTYVGGFAVGEALGAWYTGNHTVPRILTDSCAASTHYPCNPTCDTKFPTM